jgi:Domain of unknown function (DUF397)
MNPSTFRWRKSSHSSNVADCVEVAIAGAEVAVRDSKNPTGPTLTLPAHTFATLLRSA